MQEQRQIQTPGPLLGPDGSLTQRGYSTQAVLEYDRTAIQAPPWRVKEWDFYQVSNDRYAVQLTIGHASYAGDVSVRLFEFASGKRCDSSRMLILPFGRLNMPPSAERGDLTYRKKVLLMEFQLRDGERRLIVKSTGSGKQPPIDIDIRLEQPDRTSIVLATPFDESRQQFYYNHKINAMPASGVARVGEQAVLDDGTVVEVKDRVAFAEHAVNRW